MSLIVEDRNYDEKSLQRLADASRSGDTLAGAAAQPQKGSGDPKGALRCVTKAVTDNATGRLTRLIHARFQGRDAYFAVYLEASSADKPKLAVVWVASRDDCSLLSLAFSRI